MSTSGVVTRHTLRQQIADALRDEILAGRLLHGREFTVKHIADQYGVSATPVREALVDLAAQGLLDSDQRRGFRVHRFTVDDFCAMVEARALLEDGVFERLRTLPPGGAAVDAVQAGGGGLAAGGSRSLVSVRRRAQEAARAARAGDVAVLIGYDLRFWRELSLLGGNPYVSEFLDRMRVQAWVFAVPYLREDPDAHKWLWSRHEALVDAVAAGDVPALQGLLREFNDHLLTWANTLRGN